MMRENEIGNHLRIGAGHHPRRRPLEQGKAARSVISSAPFYTLAAAISFAGLSLAAREPAYRGQPSVLVVTVIDSGAQYPLVNADVIDLSTGQHRFTDEAGQARLAWPSDGQLRLRVREVGYQPQQRTLRQAATPNAAATFAMNKVAYVISPVRAISHCSSGADSASLELSRAVLDQLKQGAEKYDQFRRHYPFEATVERQTAPVPEGRPRAHRRDPGEVPIGKLGAALQTVCLIVERLLQIGGATILSPAARQQQEQDQDDEDARLTHGAKRSVQRAGGYSQRPTLAPYS